MAREKAGIEELLSLMFVIGRFMRSGATKRGSKKTVSHSMLQFETVRYVKERERPLMRDVAAYFSITPPAATLLVDGLVKEGLLSRIVDAKDRRAVRVRLTVKGKAFLARWMEEKAEKWKKLFGTLTADEQLALIGILSKMAKSARS